MSCLLRFLQPPRDHLSFFETQKRRGPFYSINRHVHLVDVNRDAFVNVLDPYVLFGLLNVVAKGRGTEGN